MTDESRPPADSDAPRRKAPVKRKHTVGRVVGISALVLALVTALSVVWLYRHLNGNITSLSTEVLGDDRPEKTYTGNGAPMNILVMGSDTRSGEGNDIDSEAGGGGSDTTILVHLSADRSRAYAVSIPRDSIVDRPGTPDSQACGDNPAATEVRWNAAFTTGGALCTVAQLEQETDVFVDHFVVIDFNGFGQMVDAVGGVPVCVPEDLVDKEHQIFVPAGDPSLLTGDQALDYVRARYVGEQIQQNDISRIRRQQAFIAALVREVKSAGTLTRLDRVVKFLEAATSSLQTDDQFDSLTRVGKVALQLQNIGLNEVKFITTPTAYYPRESEHWGQVYWTEDADKIWEYLRSDEVIPPKFLNGAVSAEQEGGESPSPTETTSPSESSSQTPSEAPSETSSPSEPTETPTEDPIPGICQ